MQADALQRLAALVHTGRALTCHRFPQGAVGWGTSCKPCQLAAEQELAQSV